MKFKVLLVIPARYGSTRLPGKPLKKIGDKSLIQRVYERAKKVNCIKTIVATDNKKILHHCKINKIECIMTQKNHLTGTDRISEVSKKYNFKWVLNIQGDEPLINVNDVKNFIKKTLSLYKKQKFSASTLYFKKKKITNLIQMKQDF
jgi:CMP-2-keto-3-deoxyoctulosonic acid synthetase